MTLNGATKDDDDDTSLTVTFPNNLSKMIPERLHSGFYYR